MTLNCRMMNLWPRFSIGKHSISKIKGPFPTLLFAFPLSNSFSLCPVTMQGKWQNTIVPPSHEYVARKISYISNQRRTMLIYANFCCFICPPYYACARMFSISDLLELMNESNGIRYVLHTIPFGEQLLHKSWIGITFNEMVNKYVDFFLNSFV